MKFDKYHLHEIADRVHIINSMIDDFLIEHPGMTKSANQLCEVAQQNLSAVIGLTAEQEPTIK